MSVLADGYPEDLREEILRLETENARLLAENARLKKMCVELGQAAMNIEQKLTSKEAENERLRALLHRWMVWGEGQEHDLEKETRRALERKGE